MRTPTELLSSGFPLWTLLVWACFCWKLHCVLHQRWRLKEWKNVTIVKYTSWVGHWFPGLYYLWYGPEILLHNYKRGVPLAVKTPETYYIHFSSEDHVTELKDAPEEQLSLHALSKDMFLPKYTMNGLEVHNRMNANGSLHTRVLRVVLRSHLKDLCLPLSRIISSVFDKEFNQKTTSMSDWVELPVFAVVKKVITATNAFAIFGSDLASDATFLEAALAYPEDLFFTAEILRLLPSPLHPLLAPLLMRNHQASKTMVKYLTPVVEERLRRLREDSRNGKSKMPKPIDCIQFFVDANSHKDQWTAQKIVQVLLGIWFAALHQPALTAVYALQDLCKHAEYFDPLRRELSSTYHCCLGDTGQDYPLPAATLQNAPLLDAFLKESSRLHPSDSISVRRKVLEPFKFKDGTYIIPGDVACLPSQAIMRDENIYPASLRFSPWRFIKQAPKDKSPINTQNTSRFTDTDLEYPLWGLGRHSW